MSDLKTLVVTDLSYVNDLCTFVFDHVIFYSSLWTWQSASPVCETYCIYRYIQLQFLKTYYMVWVTLYHVLFYKALEDFDWSTDQPGGKHRKFQLNECMVKTAMVLYTRSEPDASAHVF